LLFLTNLKVDQGIITFDHAADRLPPLVALTAPQSGAEVDYLAIQPEARRRERGTTYFCAKCRAQPGGSSDAGRAAMLTAAAGRRGFRPEHSPSNSLAGRRRWSLPGIARRAPGPTERIPSLEARIVGALVDGIKGRTNGTRAG
jgi:hypothetical protein